MEQDDPFADWIPLTTQVPRKDQLVRVMTLTGVEHQAHFTVAYTTDWPEGASWTPTRDEMRLPFWDVWIWSPNPDAAAPPLEDAWAPEPVEAPAPELEPDETPHLPAVVQAVLDEIGRGKTILSTLPPDGLDWSPQPRIASLRTLACRMIRVLERIQWIVELSDAERMLEPEPALYGSTKEIQDAYGTGAKPVRAALESLDDHALADAWTLTINGQPRVSVSRAEALLVYGLRPLAHVAAEISVLLRALDLAPEHPTPLWPFTDEPEFLVIPEPDPEPDPVPEPATPERHLVAPSEQSDEAEDLDEGSIEPDVPAPANADDASEDSIAQADEEPEADGASDPDDREAPEGGALDAASEPSATRRSLDERRRILADRRRRA